MNRSVLFLVFLILGIPTFSQTAEERVVRQFGEDLHNLCSMQDMIYFEKAQGLCSRACRVRDLIMQDFIKKNSNLKSDLIPTYLQEFYNARKKGLLNINVKNIRTIEKGEQVYSSHYGVSTLEQEAKRANNYATIACEILIDGALSYHVLDLYYVHKGNGNIVKITPYEEVVDQKTGKKKVKVDFSDLVKEHTIEVSYGYSSNFPLNIGLSTNISYFNIGLEYGQSFDNTPISFKQHKNFATSKLNGKCFYLMASPGVFLRWATINCGLGATMATYEYESVYSSYDEKKVYFSMKPRVSFNLPVPVNFKSKKEKLFICPYVGYLYTPKLKDLNGIEFGIGLRFRFETY